MFQRFPGSFDSLAQISQYVSRAAEQAGLDPGAVYAVQLAVDEACANIIEHAYGGEGRGDIECLCSNEADALKIVLRDQGRPFDPHKVPQPDLNGQLEDCPLGGIGLHLMRKVMDEVRFELVPEAGNLCIMVKNKNQSSL